MGELTGQKQLEERVASKSIYVVLQRLSNEAKRYAGGGSYNHRIVGMGHLAATYVEKMDLGQIPGMTKETTFHDLRTHDEENYQLMIRYMLPLFQLFEKYF